MSTPALNPLVTKIRAAHPGAYDDMDDATLTKAVLAKYPQYSDLAAPAIQKPNVSMQTVPENFAEKVGANLATAYEHTKPIVQNAANDLYTASAPNIADQIQKRLRGQPNELHKIPQQAVMTWLAAGGVPEGEAAAPAEAPVRNLPEPTSPLDRLRNQPISPAQPDYVPQRPSIERLAPPAAKPATDPYANVDAIRSGLDVEGRREALRSQLSDIADKIQAEEKAKPAETAEEPDLLSQATESLNRFKDWKASGAPRFVYRARDFGEEGIPLKQSHAQAGSDLDQIMKYAEPGQRSEEGNQVIRVDLSKLKPSDYVLKAHPDGSQWAQFTRPLDENEVTVYAGKRASTQ